MAYNHIAPRDTPEWWNKTFLIVYWRWLCHHKTPRVEDVVNRGTPVFKNVKESGKGPCVVLTVALTVAT